MGKMVFAVLRALAELERSLILERVIAAYAMLVCRANDWVAAAGFSSPGGRFRAARGRSDVARHCQAMPCVKDYGDHSLALSNCRVIGDLPASAIARSPPGPPPGFSYGTTKLTEVPQFA